MGISVFAVEDTAVQVTWRDLPTGPLRLRVGDAEVVVDSDGGPGAAVIGGLEPDTAYRLVAEPHRTGSLARRLRTLASPPGAELYRLATVSDCHVGGHDFGHLPRRYGGAASPHERCLGAALREAADWGAELVVAKGDLTQAGDPDEWSSAAAVLAVSPVPVQAIPGNHDTRGDLEGARRTLAAVGVPLAVGGAACRDLPGLRLVTADVTVAGRHGGRAGPVAGDVCAFAASAPGAVLVAVHQQFQRWERPTYWPPGIPASDGRAFLDALAATNPATLVTSGHTHRHRVRRHGPLRLSEVGSTKDFPGTWAGYAVHEGGIRQVVRRVADPGALRWTDATRRSFLGTWGPWASGTLGARCFSHTWPRR